MGEPVTTALAAGALVQVALGVARDDTERARLEDLAGRWDRRRLQVIVAGEAKRGKSTVVNAILGRPVLPTGVVPLTSVSTRVTSAGSGVDSVRVTFLDGHHIDTGTSELHRYVTEPGNPANRRGVREVTVHVASPVLDTHAMDLIDTPGIGSVFAHNTEEARRTLAQLDAAVLVISADPPITAAELELLQTISETSVRTFVLVNKIDRLTPEELAESLAFTRHVCARATGRELDIGTCSALLGDRDPGFAGFAAELGEYLAARGAQDLDTALQGHTRRTLVSMLDVRRVERRALELAAQGRSAATQELRLRLTAIAEQRTQVTDRLGGSIRRLRRELDQAAGATVPEIARRCRAAFELGWTEQLEDTPLNDLEEAARKLVADNLARQVEAWRAGQASTLERQLAVLADQARADTTAQLDLARQAVRDVFDLTVNLESVEPALAPDARFHFDFSPGQSWDPPLKDVWAGLRSRQARRRRIRTAVLSSIHPMADRQVGRARADLQQRLDETGRDLARSLEHSLSQTIEQLRAPLDAAAEGADSAVRQARLLQLSDEETALQSLLAQLAA